MEGTSFITFTGGGSIQGERDSHLGLDGEWGMGISIVNGCHDITIKDLSCSACWGDGLYIVDSNNVTLDNMVSTENRRQGLSVIGGQNLVVRNSTFSNTHGTLPESGLDLEPEQGYVISGVLISGCIFEGNAGAGLQTGMPIAGQSVIENVTIEKSTFRNNGKLGLNGTMPGVLLSDMKTCTITSCESSNNGASGIWIYGASENIDIKESSLINNDGYGVEIYNLKGGSLKTCSLTGNKLGPYLIDQTENFEIVL
jgi:hypothetical protein